MNRVEIARSLRPAPEEAARYRAQGYWSDETVSGRVAQWAAEKPGEAAFITPAGRFTWAEYHRTADAIAAMLMSKQLPRGARVAVLLPDGAAVHAAYVGIERAGLVCVGMGARAGLAEIAHLMRRTKPSILITHEIIGKRTVAELSAGLAEHKAPPFGIVVVPDLIAFPDWGEKYRLDATAPSDPDALYLINSTSGTTGMPKCVMHTQNRWFYFHRLAAAAGGFQASDVFLGAVPAPFGFGLWTAHFSPVSLGCSTVILPQFDADVMLDMIERERVTVLGCVSTQFIMMLNAQAARPRDLSSLRCMFTGGEAVPYERAAEFEEVTGASVLQFYGSNETGALSRTTAADTRDHRLTTAGAVIPEMEVRLFDPATHEEVQTRGQPGCRGPAACIGYWDDDEANAKLFTKDGWMLMGDIVEIDEAGYLRVVGRTSEFIIRGGKNLSAPAIEAEVASHPGVALCAAVAAPDPVFGERVCIYVEARPGHELSLESINKHLNERGVSREWHPEYLVLMDALPRSSGGKVSKGDLARDAKERWASR